MMTRAAVCLLVTMLTFWVSAPSAFAQAPAASASSAPAPRHYRSDLDDELPPDVREKLTPEQLHDIMMEHAKRPPVPARGKGPEEVVVPVAMFSMIIAIVAITVYAGYRAERQKHETLRLVIERGGEIPTALLVKPVNPRADLRRGLLLLSVGLGLGILLLATKSGSAHSHLPRRGISRDVPLRAEQVRRRTACVSSSLGPSDAELIARILDRDDRHAFATLVRRHQSPVRTLLRRLTCGDVGAADDLAQETFLSAYRSLGRFRGGTWLYRIAYNRWIDQRRVQRDAPKPLDDRLVARDDMTNIEARHDLERAMAVLREDERAALALTYGADATHEEAAAILEIPLGTLKTQVLTAKQKLKAALTERPS